MKVGEPSGIPGGGAPLGNSSAFQNSVQPQGRGTPPAELGGLVATGRRSGGDTRAPLSFLFSVTGKDERSGPPRAALLDLDGTLVDSAQLQAHSWVLFCKEQLGLKLEPHEPDAFTGSNAQIIMTLGTRVGRRFTPDEAAFLADCKDEIFRELIEKDPIHARDGVHDFLKLAQEKDVPFAIVTNSVEKNAWPMIRQTGLDQYFRTQKQVVTGSDVAAKPNPEGYETGAARVGQSPGECFVLDDTRGGVLASEGVRPSGTWATGIVNDTMAREDFGQTPEGRTRVFTDFPELNEQWLAERGR
ncbi:HAD family phosphatase [Trinickia sp. LjRoot230]|uniref:HAD family hydrolase n=1 Tax=Trinickia sp. LjRoot230 TaxID=3342288 RepID=UPI003ED10DE3